MQKMFVRGRLWVIAAAFMALSVPLLSPAPAEARWYHGGWGGGGWGWHGGGVWRGGWGRPGWGYGYGWRPGCCWGPRAVVVAPPLGYYGYGSGHYGYGYGPRPVVVRRVWGPGYRGGPGTWGAATGGGEISHTGRRNGCPIRGAAPDPARRLCLLDLRQGPMALGTHIGVQGPLAPAGSRAEPWRSARRSLARDRSKSPPVGIGGPAASRATPGRAPVPATWR